MFISDICLFVWYFPHFCTSDMSKYGYLEVFQRVPSTSRYRESTVPVNDTVFELHVFWPYDTERCN